ncbi:hypothetical protein [Methanofollis fontis]|uniref:Uncharacterized protein n=1 Tax=Methanofollis fontis TaxID=2052832 RepID=A0A483CPP0_9EURY|nr:hypothetical protein [Methanofollis fontis]TAJ44068.1 hypothetical protein CUJ86_08515 [Methanofollis fontis]
MTEKNRPCCAAEAMRRIRQIEVGGIVVGLAMLDDTIDGVREMDLHSADSIADELLKQIKIYNYVPGAAEAAYRAALLREYEMR